MKMTSILSELEREGFVIVPIRGISMRPLLYAAESRVFIRHLEGSPKKNDVVLYVRPDGEQVLHRVIGFEGDICLIRGDNTFRLERVPLSAVKGVMVSFWRGRHITKRSREHEVAVTDLRYRLYVWFWNLIYPVRWLKFRMSQRVRKAGRRILGDTSLAWVVKMVQGSLVGVLFLTICSGVVSVLSVASALVMREAIDAAVALDRGLFLRWVMIFLVVIMATLGINAVIRQVDENTTATMENRLKARTYDNILSSSYSSLKAFHSGELQNRLTSDVQIVADYAVELVPAIVSMVVQLVCALAVLMTLDWRFASIFLIGGLVMMGVTLRFRRRMKELHKEVQESDGLLRSWMQESVENILIIKSFNAEKMAFNQTGERAEIHKKARMRRRSFSNVCNVGFGAVMQGSYLFGLVWCCVGILKGTLTYGTLTAVLQLINQIRSPFANISGLVPQYYSMLASAERLMEIEKLPKDKKQQSVLPEFQSLHARNLTFIYDDGEEEVIKDASFDIRKGELVALTGISGIGKSTLLKLLMGIYRPISGQLYAEAGHKDFKIEINASTRGWFSYVPQGNMLMSGSIYEAVDFLHAAPYTKVQKERVEQACRLACADEFIRDLPDGYHTVLGEKGAGLSEGQMQRIAIARAIYRNAPILLLDEATSALDEATEERLLNNLKLLRNQTVLIVTHKLAALKICEKRLEFDRAQIFEDDIINGVMNAGSETGSLTRQVSAGKYTEGQEVL